MDTFAITLSYVFDYVKNINVYYLQFYNGFILSDFYGYVLPKIYFNLIYAGRWMGGGGVGHLVILIPSFLHGYSLA